LAPEHRVRLLHFVESGDTSGYFRQLAAFADRSRFDVTIATLKPTDPRFLNQLRETGADHFSLGCRGRWSYPLGLLRLVQRLARVDVLHAHLFDPGLVGLLAGALAQTRVRVLTRHYSDYHTRIHKRSHVAVDRLTTRLSHAVIAVSEDTARHLIEVEQAPTTKVRTIVNGVDFARLALSPPEVRARLRSELGGDDALVLLLPARLHPEKGHTFLFRALELLRDAESRRFVALIAGAGPSAAAYAAEVQTRGIVPQVRFLGHRHDVADLMAISDAVVLPSVAEAFGLVLVEALYLGTPVIATRVGGIPEIVADGIDGMLVPPADPSALAEALRAFAANPGLRERLRGAGSARMKDRFGFPAMMQAYEGLYEELLGRRP